MTKKSRVPVGATPISKYATWEEHRDALRQEALARREKYESRRDVVAPR